MSIDEIKKLSVPAAGILVSWVLTRVVLTLVFYLVVTPLGLAMRFLGKCPLDLSFPGEESKKSYWNRRPEQRAEAVQMERQF